MSSIAVSKDKAILRESLARIDMQLFKKGLYNQSLNQRIPNYLTIQVEKEKLFKEKAMQSTLASTYASQRTIATSHNKESACSIDISSKKKIEKELEPYFTINKTESPTIFNTNNDERKYAKDIKDLQDELGSITALVRKNENDSKIEIDQLVHTQGKIDYSIKGIETRLDEVVGEIKEINLNKKKNEKNTNPNDNSKDIDKIYKQIEDKIMSQVEAKLNALKLDYETKIEILELQTQKNVKRELNQELNLELEPELLEKSDNETKKYIDNKTEALSQTLQSEIKEVYARIDQISNQISTKTNEPSPSFLKSDQLISQTLAALSEQSSTITNQINQIKTDQNLLSTELKALDSLTHENNQSLSVHQSQINKLKNKIRSLKTFFHQYKKEQIKLNDMYEKILTTFISNMLSLQEDTKAVLDDQDRIEDNFEISQRNFEQLKPVIETHPKMKKDLIVVTEIIQTLTQDYKEIKGEVNNNFSSLSNWQIELVESVTKAVNELKLDYNEKFRKSNAIIGGYNDKMDDKNKTKEVMNKIDLIQSANDKKYVLKNELDLLKEKINEIEKMMKDNVNKADQPVLIQSKNNNDNINKNLSDSSPFVFEKNHNNLLQFDINWSDNVPNTDDNATANLNTNVNAKDNGNGNVDPVNDMDNQIFVKDQDWDFQ